MPQINGEMGQPRLHIAAVPIPLAEPLNREPMVERMQAGTPPAIHGLDAQPLAQRTKPAPKRLRAESLPLLGDKQHLRQHVIAPRGPLRHVLTELIGRRNMEGNETGFMELRFPDVEEGRVILQMHIRHGQAKRFPNA